MKIAFSGGHITPALACIDYIQAHAPEETLVLLGRTYSQRGGQQLAHEKEIALSRHIQFFPLDGTRWQTDSLGASLVSVIGLCISTIRAIWLLLKLYPDVVVSFGGYVAVPLALGARFLRIPLVTHEQTRTGGTANRLIGRMAQKVALSHASSRPFFPAKKTVVTGNLLRQSLFQVDPPRPAWITRLPTIPLIYITGGSQGSEVINSVVQQALPKLLKQYFIIHQCGKDTASRAYQSELRAQVARVKQLQHRYYVKDWFSESELAWILQHATAAVSRAGANTVDELVASRVPTIFIPLPYTHDEEQQQNAEAIVKTAGAVFLDQKNLDQDTLLATLRQVVDHADTMKQHLMQFQFQADAPAQFYQIITSVSKKTRSR